MPPQPVGLRQSIAFGEDFEFDLRPLRLRHRGRVLKLERIPLDILLLFLEHPGQLLTRDAIVARIWGKDAYLDTDNSIRSAIRKIRRVLKDDHDQPRFIQTVTGQGYRFIAPVFAPPSDEFPPEALVSDSPIPDSGVNDFPSRSPSLRDGSALHAEPPPLLPASAALRSQPRGTWRWILLALMSVAILTAGFLLLKSRLAGTASPAIKSIAVLPLKNLSGDPTQDYFADGMTESLIGRLSSVRGLRVISRTSVMQFKDPHLSVPRIARLLGVDAVVEGSVIREGNRVRVHAQLIRAATDEHFWSETYDRELGDVLTLESNVAQAIAEKVEVTITGQEQALLTSARPISPEVYENYLKGSSANRNTRSGTQQSVAWFQAAIDKDPAFAPAYVGLASAYEELGSVYGGVSPGETRPRLIRAAQKALELDPELAEAHVLLAATYQKEWAWQESEAEYRRALDLKPNDAPAHRGYASWLVCQGRLEEGSAQMERARALDPLGVQGLVTDGFLLFIAHHNDESLQLLRSVLAVQPDDATANWFLGYALIANGQPAEAVHVLEKATRLSNRSPAVIGVLIRAYAHAGRRADALRLLAELKSLRKAGYVPAGAFVNAYLGLGDNEQAFIWLERALQEKSPIVQFLKVHPHFDPIRGDPRFAGLLHRTGLDQQIP